MYFKNYKKADLVHLKQLHIFVYREERKNNHFLAHILSFFLVFVFLRPQTDRKSDQCFWLDIVLPFAIFHPVLPDNKGTQTLSSSLWNLQTGTSTSIDSRLAVPAIGGVHRKWIAALFAALNHERILRRQTHVQAAADKDYIVGFSLSGGVHDGEMDSGERWMAAQGRACCVSDVKVFRPHAPFQKGWDPCQGQRTGMFAALSSPFTACRKANSWLNIAR